MNGWMDGWMGLPINPLVIYTTSIDYFAHVTSRLMKISILVEDRSAVHWQSFVFLLNFATDTILNLNRNQLFEATPTFNTFSA